MHSFTALVLGFLAFGSRVVLSLDFKLQLSQVEQCQPVTINISGRANAEAVPKWLNIISFNSTPIAIPLPTITKDASGSFSGVFTAVLPLAEGANFVATLDDEAGENVARVSDVFRVLHSSTGDASCLPQLSVQTRRYNFNNTLVQCGTFALSYDTTAIKQAPSVRVYNPTGFSTLLNLTADDPASGVAAYTMSFERSKQIVMLFDDNHGHQETSPLVVVEGDNSTTTTCLNTNSYAGVMPGDGPDDSAASSSPRVSRAIIIGSAIAGGSVLSVAVCLFAFILRERRKRRRQANDPEFEPVLAEKGFRRAASPQKSPILPLYPSPAGVARKTPSPQLRGFLLQPSTSPAPSPVSGRRLPYSQSSPGPSPIATTATSPISMASAEIVRNPLYTSAGKLYSPGSSSKTRDSLASWAQPLPEDPLSPRSTHTIIPNGDRLSLNSLDIEGMLNMAASQSSRNSHQSDPAPHGPNPLIQAFARRPSSPTIPLPSPQLPATVLVSTPPSSAGIKRWPSRGHLRPPSDVPKGPVSMTFSSISADPFHDEHASVNFSSPFVSPRTTLNMKRSMSFESALQYPPEALLGLPKSPADGRSLASPRLFVLRERERNRHTNSQSVASADVSYGVAQ